MLHLTRFSSDHDRLAAAEPENNMIKQQRALLSTEGVNLRFTDEAVMVGWEAVLHRMHVVHDISIAGGCGCSLSCRDS